MPRRSPMLRALMSARDDVPEALRRFDAIARAGAAPPSFEEYSARVGGGLSPWRETCYFDVGADPRLVSVANERFERLAEALDVDVPGRFFDVLAAQGAAGPEVLQIVLGIDAAGERTRLKYYLIFADRSGATVERLRTALEVPPPPATLQPDAVYILGIDFCRQGLGDFKIYVRLDPRRVPAVLANLAEFEVLWRASRYLVFQHCQIGGGRQVYFHASSASVLERWLRDRAGRDPEVAAFREQISTMNRLLRAEGHQLLRPWIASFPYRDRRLLARPSNVYFHFSA